MRASEGAKREIDYVLLSAFGIIGTALSSQTRQSELTLQGRGGWRDGGGGDLEGAKRGGGSDSGKE